MQTLPYTANDTWEADLNAGGIAQSSNADTAIHLIMGLNDQSRTRSELTDTLAVLQSSHATVHCIQ